MNDPESLERPLVETQRAPEFERKPKGLASLLVARVLGEAGGRNSSDGDSTPGSRTSVITTSAAAFGEYQGLEDAQLDTSPSFSVVDGDVFPTTTRLNHATAALTNTIVGAGIVALPKAFASLGVVPGSLLLGAFFYLSRYTLAAMIRSANTVGVWTYDELVRNQFGSWGARSLDAAIVVNNLGGLLIYLIIIGDLLVGKPPFYSGIVTNALNIHGGDVWWVSREFVVGVVSLLVLFPLVSLRDISGLGRISVYSVSVAVSLVGMIGLLAIDAAFQGKLATDVSVWFPNLDALGGSSMRAVMSAVAILPVISVTFCCHYNLFPVATNLERFSDRRIAMVIRRSLMVCTVLFFTLAVSGVALFGSATEGNVLVNLRPEVVDAYMSERLAAFLCLTVRILYLLVIISSFPMLNWALRETTASYLFGSRTLEGQGKFLLFSFGLVLAEYVLSVIFPEIWTVMALTGATAAVYVSFILPGALVYKTSEGGEDWFMARFSIVFGVVMMLFGVIDNV
jgi:sodium-coupled neutral amino acid transporter 2